MILIQSYVKLKVDPDEHIGLVLKAAGLMESRGYCRGTIIEKSDLISEGTIALMISCRKFDDTKFDCKFSSFAYIAILRRMRRAIKIATDKGTPRPKDRYRHRDENLEMSEVLPDHREINPGSRACDRITVESVLRSLSTKEHRVIVAAYGLDGSASRNDAEIGRDLRVTRQRIQKIRESAIKRMRLFAQLKLPRSGS